LLTFAGGSDDETMPGQARLTAEGDALVRRAFGLVIDFK
jgi:hypothetical protein